jgi:hypothetical protein
VTARLEITTACTLYNAIDIFCLLKMECNTHKEGRLVPFKNVFLIFSSTFAPFLGSCFVLECVEKQVNISPKKKLVL